MGREALAEGPIRVFSRSENESGVLGSEIGFCTLVFSADVIIQRTEAGRPGKGGNSENIPFESDVFNKSNGKW